MGKISPKNYIHVEKISSIMVNIFEFNGIKKQSFVLETDSWKFDSIFFQNSISMGIFLNMFSSSNCEHIISTPKQRTWIYLSVMEK
jgi:hypothetical protein